MIDVDEALRRLMDEAAPLDVVETAIDCCDGLVLAETVTADRDFPPTDRSAMDGFAVCSADPERLAGALRVLGEQRAGQPAGSLEVEPGTAVRIMTGAIVPRGADAVVMVEKTDEDRGGGLVTLKGTPVAGQNVRRRGQDRRRGDVVLEAGTVLHAPEIAALCSVGRTRVKVHRPPRVALLSTGDEIVEPECEPLDHQVRNSNAVTLSAQLRELGIRGRYLGIARDDGVELGEALRQAASADVLLVTGGVSAGEYDLVKESLISAGARVLFHQVAMKPGKPVLAARLGSSLVLGLPGNPLSTYTAFAVLVVPVLRRMMGYGARRTAPFRAELEQDLRGTEGRRTYHLATIAMQGGALRVRPVSSTGSGDVLSLASANGFIVTEPGRGPHQRGEQVEIELWRNFQERGRWP